MVIERLLILDCATVRERSKGCRASHSKRASDTTKIKVGMWRNLGRNIVFEMQQVNWLAITYSPQRASIQKLVCYSKGAARELSRRFLADIY